MAKKFAHDTDLDGNKIVNSDPAKSPLHVEAVSKGADVIIDNKEAPILLNNGGGFGSVKAGQLWVTRNNGQTGDDALTIYFDSTNFNDNPAFKVARDGTTLVRNNLRVVRDQVNTNNVSANVIVLGDDGEERQIKFGTMGKSDAAIGNHAQGIGGYKDVLRWQVGIADGQPDSGSNNGGSDFFISRNMDDGTYWDDPFVIRRATGQVIIKYEVKAADADTTAVNKKYVDDEVAKRTRKYANDVTTTAATWTTVTHSLGTPDVMVQAYENSEMVLCDVKIIDGNTIQVRTTAAHTLRVVVVG